MKTFTKHHNILSSATALRGPQTLPFHLMIPVRSLYGIHLVGRYTIFIANLLHIVYICY